MPYPPDFARLYNWLVHGEAEPTASAEELAFLQHVFRQLARRPVQDVLDVGCGQGRILLPLVREGLSVTGLDLSPDMLQHCRDRLAGEGFTTPLQHASMEELEADAEFDALIAFDSVVCYLHEPERLVPVLERFRRALRPGGVLVIDNWNMLGNWELLTRPQRLSFGDGQLRLEGEERSRYESFRSLWHMELDVRVTEGRRTYPFRHTETLRAMTPGELREALLRAGFTALELFADYAVVLPATGEPEQIQFVAVRP